MDVQRGLGKKIMHKFSCCNHEGAMPMTYTGASWQFGISMKKTAPNLSGSAPQKECYSLEEAFIKHFTMGVCRARACHTLALHHPLEL